MKRFSDFLLHSSRQALRLAGYASRFAETEHGRIHYYVGQGRGQLPPMVFLHGLSAHAAELAPVFQRLRRHTKKIYAVDLPVHGLSESPKGGILPEPLSEIFYQAMNQILEKDEPVILFGNSLGGLGALRYTNRAPDKVRLLVLSSPGGANVGHEGLQRLTEIFCETTQMKPQDFVRRLYNDPPFYRHIVASIVKHRFSRPELVELIAQFHPETLLTPKELQRVKIPTLLIWGKQDRLLENHLDFYKAHMPPNFRLDEPRHFTHCPYMEMPLELANKILHWAQLHCYEGLSETQKNWMMGPIAPQT